MIRALSDWLLADLRLPKGVFGAAEREAGVSSVPTGSAPKPNRPSRGCVQRGGWVAATLVGGAGVAPPGSFTTVTNGGGQLKLLGLTKRVKDLLQITKLYTVFEVFDDESSAIRSFA